MKENTDDIYNARKQVIFYENNIRIYKISSLLLRGCEYKFTRMRN